ncbi:hypothetical protein OG864_29650 [Streptomyces sp. NBC_00124]|uniref:hypothetical protein n=1 Tax=Streptomyces sp. NBC_00124 TaxID=2975662 RepID=UPI002251C6DF|nr:hypothetical protein [Streptomyces sp. NBC_00124]MCX5362866.1 hypothetical protein [Streptomyces sp. NBC_00124]
MPARLPLDDLRSAMEQASGATATVSDRGPFVRVSVPMPNTPEGYEALLAVVQHAAAWGSTDGTGELRLWASVIRGRQS